MAVLFQSHQDLLDEFTHFLPDQTASGPQSTSGRGFLRREEKTSGVTSARHAQVDKAFYTSLTVLLFLNILVAVLPLMISLGLLYLSMSKSLKSCLHLSI